MRRKEIVVVPEPFYEFAQRRSRNVTMKDHNAGRGFISRPAAS
jgi:hypothetical protein